MGPSSPVDRRTSYRPKSVSWIIPAAAILAWSAVFGVIAHRRYGGDIRGFLSLGENIAHPSALADAPRVGPDGYDGQFYAALAADPLIRRRETGESLDNPGFRGSRIMIPLLAWLLSAGNGRAAVFVYEILCWLLGFASVVLVAAMLGRERGSPAWALLLVPGAGLAASLFRATPDAGTLAFVLAALWFRERDRFAAAFVFAVMAALSREITVILAFALALDALRKRRIGRAAAFAAGPIAALLAWKTYLQIWIGSGFSSGEQLFGFPFFWAYRKVGEMALGRVKVEAVEVLGILAIAASLAGVVAVISRPKRWSAAELTYLGFGLLVPFLSYSVFAEVWGYARILIILPFLGLALAARQEEPWRKWSLRSGAVLQAILGLLLMAGELRAAF